MSFFLQFITHLKQWFAMEQAMQAVVADVVEHKSPTKDQLIALCEAAANLLESGAVGNIDKSTVDMVKQTLEDIINASNLPSAVSLQAAAVASKQ